MTFPKLTKLTSTGAIQEWELFVEGDSYWTVYGQRDGKKITGAKTTCTAKNPGKSNATTPEQQALLEAQAKWVEKRDKHHYSEGESNQDSFFKVMLAKNYNDYKDKVVFPCLYNPKLDGIRYVANKEGGHSRNGKPLGGMYFIREMMKPFFKAHPEAILDGEAFSGKYRDDFQQIVSMIKRDESSITPAMKTKIESCLEYHIYDVPIICDLTGEDSYLDRWDRFWEIVNNEFPELLSHIKKVPATVVASHEQVRALFEDSVAQGYEGGILRWNAPYENKRTWKLLKIKEFQDEEFEIVEVLEGRGNKANTAGSVTLKSPSGVLFNSNIKGGYELYDKLWAERQELIGKHATCKFFGYSTDGIPRFPYVINIDRTSYE